MTVILCVDNRYGLLFAKRRQSRDRAVIHDIITHLSGKRLFFCPYSAALFPETDAVVSEDFLEQAGQDDVCFVEDRDIEPYLSKIHTLILYHWNRDYPSDFKLNPAMLESFRLEKTTDFAGFSHETITKEEYIR